MSSLTDTGKIRVLIADNHPVLREALKLLLEKRGCEVIGSVSNGNEALKLAATLSPQVILMDIEMQGSDGLAAARRIRELCLSSRIVILSAHDDEQYVLDALENGIAVGYVVKSDCVEELLPAVRAAVIGRPYISRSISPNALIKLRLRRPARQEKMLTPSEFELLNLIGQGVTATKRIGEVLGISHETVRRRKNNLKRKLSLRTTARVVQYAMTRRNRIPTEKF